MQVIELPITAELLRKGEEAYKKQPKYQSTKNLNDKRDLIGCIGQEGVLDWFFYEGLAPTYGSYFDESMQGDEYDFIWRYETCDVKASPTSKGYPEVYPNSNLLLKDETKEVQRLVFVKVNLHDNRLFIVGTISWNDFWGVEEEYKIGKGKPFTGNWKEPCHYIRAKELQPFKKWVYGV